MALQPTMAPGYAPGYSPFYGGYAAQPAAGTATTVSIRNAKAGAMALDQLDIELRNADPNQPGPPDLQKPGTVSGQVVNLKASVGEHEVNPVINWFMMFTDSHDLRADFQDGRVIMKGKMRQFGLDVPFEMDIRLDVTADGNIMMTLKSVKAFGFLPIPSFIGRDMMYDQMLKADPYGGTVPAFQMGDDYLHVNLHTAGSTRGMMGKVGSNQILFNLKSMPMPMQFNANLRSIKAHGDRLHILAGNGAPAWASGAAQQALATPPGYNPYGVPVVPAHQAAQVVTPFFTNLPVRN